MLKALYAAAPPSQPPPQASYRRAASNLSNSIGVDHAGPAILAAVLSQPGLPLNDPAGLEIAPEEIHPCARDSITMISP
jgi:hypothetical protein